MTSKNQLERHEQKVEAFQNEIFVVLMAIVCALTAYGITRSFGWASTAFIFGGLFGLYQITKKRRGKR